MRNVIIVILCLLFLCQTASAEFDVGIVETLAGIVDSGINKFIIGIADNLYEQTYDPEDDNYGEPETYGEWVTAQNDPEETEVYIYAIVTSNTNPWEYDEVNDFRVLTFMLLSAFCVVNAIIGFIYVAFSLLSESAADIIDSVLDRSSAFRNARIKEFFSELITMVVIIMFTDICMKVFFALSDLATSMFLVSELESNLLSPSEDNPILYVLIAIFYWGLDKIFEIRDLLLYMFVMGGYIIGMAVAFRPTRNLGISITYYLTGILFLQPIMVLVSTMGFIGVGLICDSKGIDAGSPKELGIYLALILVLIGIALTFIVGWAFMKKTATKSIRLVI